MTDASPDQAGTTSREFHPVADIFPMMSEREFQDLVTSIEQNGQREPIWVHRDGRIVDGRNRWRACQELGLTAETRVYERDDAELVKFVVDLNLRRRHLNESQRSMVAAKIARLPRGVHRDSLIRDTAIAVSPSQAEVAAELNVSIDSVQRARKVEDGGIPELVAAVEAGKLTVSAAAVIAEQSPEVQREIIAADDEKGIIRRANEFKRQKREARKAEKEAARQKAAEAAAAVVEQITHETGTPVDMAESKWWQLGQHLLYCGDSTDSEFVDMLRTQGAAFAFADPPYNVDKADWDRGFTWKHDYLSDVASVVAVTPGISAVADLFHVTAMPYRWSMSAWVTNGMTRGALGFGNWIYVALFSGLGSIHRNAQDHLRITVDASTTGETAHESRKPARLLVDLIELFTTAGDAIIDPFLGSGTTLFAAEQTGRRCIGAEINPDYCREIIARYGASARPL